MAKLGLREDKERFQVTAERWAIEHGCCYNYAVIDTAKPQEYPKGSFETLCEVYTRDDAKRIADALNNTFPLEKSDD